LERGDTNEESVDAHHRDSTLPRQPDEVVNLYSRPQTSDLRLQENQEILVPEACGPTPGVDYFTASTLARQAPAAWAKQPDKVAVCHYPPNNPSHFWIMYVAATCVPNHVAHGDHVVTDELCNGIDDCDGAIDEDGVCP